MNTFLTYGWIICFIVSYLIRVIVPFFINTSDVNGEDTKNKILVFFEIISWILAVMGFIMFIVWLTRFNNISILKTLWIASLITWIVSMGILIFLAGNAQFNIDNIFISTLSYSFTIFIGSLITFLVKNK